MLYKLNVEYLVYGELEVEAETEEEAISSTYDMEPSFSIPEGFNYEVSINTNYPSSSSDCE
jgi:hypothetical protein